MIFAVCRHQSRTWLARGLVLAAALALPAASSGCNTSCDDADPSDAAPVVYDGGTRNAALTYYESDSSDGPYLEFPPQRTYDIQHGLGRAPGLWIAWVGFSSSPLGSDGNGNISVAAGNQVITEKVDDKIIRVRNDTCETFHLRVVAYAPELESPSDSGAGGESGAE